MIVVVGLGKTGMSCVRFLTQMGESVLVMDQNQAPSEFESCKQSFPDVPIITGRLDVSCLCEADKIIVSPGVPIETPELIAAAAQGVPCIGDVELFLQQAQAPVIAITGSNGKSTVTALTGEVLNAAGLSAIVCGNIGDPVLDQLLRPVPDYYVMELSSFQLEYTSSLAATAAVVLNVTEDHLDRHGTMAQYLAIKQKVYHHCKTAVLNADEAWIWSELSLPQKRYYFSTQKQGDHTFGLQKEVNAFYLTYQDKHLVNCDELPLKGLHHWQNYLAVLALAKSIGVSPEAVIPTFQRFQGLRHRCQFVAKVKEIDWYNDSKATNVGACIAALESLGQCYTKPLVLIAGGDGKGACFNALAMPIQRYVSHVVVMGQDAPRIAASLKGIVPMVQVASLEHAVDIACQVATPGAAVLLSPACASYDMFRNYEHRGDLFIEAVERL